MSVLQIDNRDGALWVTFNRPEQFNSLSPESMCAMIDIWQRAEQDDSIRLVVLTGAGEQAFCAGADLKLIGCDEVKRQVTDRPSRYR
jgi:enoyl-CoA hydratase/carnithine racemase